MIEISLLDNPGYKAEYNRLQEITTKIVETESRASQLQNDKPSVKIHTQKQVEAVLSGKEPEHVKLETNWREDLSDAWERLRVLRLAEKEQKGVVEKARLKASDEIVKGIASEYKAIVRELAMKLIEAGKVAEREKQLRERLNDANIAWIAHLTPMPFNALGDVRNPDSRISHYLSECVKFGSIVERDIPDTWLRSWGRRATGDYYKPSTVEQLVNKSKGAKK